MAYKRIKLRVIISGISITIKLTFDGPKASKQTKKIQDDIPNPNPIAKLLLIENWDWRDP
jgi:hypothetical protein